MLRLRQESQLSIRDIFVDGNTQDISVTWEWGGPGSSHVARLGAVPAGRRITFSRWGDPIRGGPMLLSNFEVLGGSDVEVRFELANGDPIFDLSIADARSVTLAGEGWSTSACRRLELGAGQHVNLTRVNTTVTASAPLEVHVEDAVATLESVVKQLSVSGRVAVFNRSVAISQMHVAADTDLSIDQLEVDGLSSAPGATLTLAVPETQRQQNNPTRLYTTSCSAGTRICFEGPLANLVIRDVAEDLQLCGPGGLELAADAVVDGLSLNACDETASGAPLFAYPRLSMAQHASLTRASGKCVTRDLVGAAISSDTSRGFEILSAEGSFEAADVRGVRFPANSRGRQILTRVVDAAHFSPDTGHLRPFTRDYRRPWATRTGKLNAGELASEAEFLRELARLAAIKGSTGAVRTKTAWASYRLRNLTAGSRTERAMLSLYRCVGYGERPLPALGMWVVAAAVLCAAGHRHVHVDLSGTGLATFLGWWWRALWSPLHLLHLAGTDESGSQLSVIAARAIIAAPFVIAAIAIRRYVKGPELLSA